jgi:hypothetical protein
MKKLMVFFVALSMVMGFTVTAAMADADLYGSIRFRTYWVDKDENYGGAAFDDEDLDWRIGYLSRWGVNYQSGNIKGKLEMDTRDSDGEEGSAELGDVRVRHLYGEWDFVRASYSSARPLILAPFMPAVSATTQAVCKGSTVPD